MLIINETSLRTVMSGLVTGTHGLTGLDRKHAHVGTIDEKVLRNAALAALFVITGDIVATEAALQKG